MSEIVDTPVVDEVVDVASEIVDTPVAEDNDEHSSSDAANGNTETEDQQLKRKRDEGDDDAENSKRAAVSTPAADTPASTGQPAAVSSISASGDEETISIAPDKVGQIIGTKVCLYDPNAQLTKSPRCFFNIINTLSHHTSS